MSFVKSRNQNTISLKIFIFNFPPSSRVSPIAVPPSHSRGNPRRLRSRGTHDAIDFVAIAIPSLRSLRFSHNSRHFSYCATRSPTKRTTLVGSLVRSVKLGAPRGRRLATPISSSIELYIKPFSKKTSGASHTKPIIWRNWGLMLYPCVK